MKKLVKSFEKRKWIEVEEAFPPGIEPGSWNDMFSALPLSYKKAFQQSVRRQYYDFSYW